MLQLSLKETGCEDVDYLQLPQVRIPLQALIETTMNLRIR
jgi:hypothetical protein